VSARLWVRFLALSLIFALLMSFGAMVLIRETTGAGNRDVQRGVCVFFARMVETDGSPAESLQKIKSYLAESAALPLNLWVIDEADVVVASTTRVAPPVLVHGLAHPEQPHGVTTYARYFPSLPEVVMVRLATPQPRFLVIQDAWRQSRRLLFWQSLIFIGSVVGAIVVGLTLATVYLRSRSHQARQVIAAMKSGELGARFPTATLDVIGHLMLDFNAMAEEIERLVTRLRAAEGVRRQLLQELGHDLRTPLTSLRTSTETLLTHHARMPATEQAEFVQVIKSELDYFQRLLEDLFLIAAMDEPTYSPNTRTVDLLSLLKSEISAVAARETGKVVLGIESPLPQAADCVLHADPHLMARLIRNGLENAAYHARSAVRVAVAVSPGWVEVAIHDDGPGMTLDEVARFGQRRSQRTVAATQGGAFASLGLGSVIMKAILALHRGELRIESALAGAAIEGTRLVFKMPVPVGQGVTH
jgi:signal transduction histidine kinase